MDHSASLKNLLDKRKELGDQLSQIQEEIEELENEIKEVESMRGDDDFTAYELNDEGEFGYGGDWWQG